MQGVDGIGKGRLYISLIVSHKYRNVLEMSVVKFNSSIMCRSGYANPVKTTFVLVKVIVLVTSVSS